MAGLNFAFTADNKNFMKALEEVTRGVDAASRQIEKDGMSVENFFNRIKNIGAISFAGFGIGEMIKKIADTRSYFQDIESSMSVFLGSAEKATEFTKELQDYAYYNMYDFAQLADASKQLIAYGNDVKDVTNIIQKLSEVGIATKQPLGEMVNLYNKAKSTGVVGGQDIASWAAKGLILRDVMKDMGTYVEGQTISFKQLNEVLDKVTAEGGMFHGIQDSMMTNISSNIAQLEDNLSLMFNEIGKYLETPIYNALQYAGELVDHWKEVGYAIASVVAAAGAQKGIDLVSASIDRTATQAMYASEQVQLEQLLGKKKEEAQSSIEQAVASGQLTQAKANEILALREEVQAQIEAISVKEKAAIIEETSAKVKLKNAEKELASAEELVSSYYEKLEAVMATGDAEAIETVVSELETAETLRNEAANIANAASEEAKAASKNVSTLAAEKEALVTGLETSATTQQTFATRILTSAKIALTKVTSRLNAAIAANPFAIAIAGAAALGYGIYKLTTYENDYEKSIHKVNDAVDETNIEAEKEIKKLDELNAKLKVCTKGTDEWKATKDAIISQYGQYFANLDTEISKTGSLTSSYKELTKAIRAAAAAKHMKDFIEKNDKTQETYDLFKSGWENFEKTKGKLSKENKARLQPILKDFATSYVGDSDIFTYVKDQLKIKYGDKAGQYMYEGMEYFLKKSDLRDFNKAQKTNRQSEVEIEKYRKIMGIDDDLYNKVRFGIEKATPEEEVQNKKYWEQKKREATASLEALTDIQAKGKEGQKLKAEIAVYDEKLSSFSTKSKTKKRSGKSRDDSEFKIKSEHQKYLDLLKQQEEERLRLQQQYEYEIWQNRINLMDEGEAKVLAQMELNKSKENLALNNKFKQDIKDEVSRQKAMFDANEELLASSNKKHKKKIFKAGDEDLDIADSINELNRLDDLINEIQEKLNNPGTNVKDFLQLSDSLTKLTKQKTEIYLKFGDIDPTELQKTGKQISDIREQQKQEQKKADQKRLDEAKSAMNQYLIAYASFEKKKKAIEEEYSNKIAEAPNAGARLQEIANREKALADLNFNEWIDSGELSLAFGDISKLSKNTITSLISSMETYRKKVLKTFDPEKIEKYESALANLRSAELDYNFIFGSDNEFVEILKERLALQKQINDLEISQSEMAIQREAIETKLNALKARGVTPDMNPTGVDEEGNLVYGNGITPEMVAQAQELQNSLFNIETALKNSASRSKELQSQLQSMRSVKFADVQKFSGKLFEAGKNAADLASIFSDDLGDAIGEAIDKAGKLFDAFSDVASNIDVLGKSAKKIVKNTTDAAEDLVNASSEGIKTSANVTAQGLSTMEKASAILAIIGAAIQFATLIASLFNSDKKHEKKIEEIQDRIDSLQKSYDRLGKAADKAFSTDASQLIEQQNTLLQQQKVLIKQQMAEEEAKKKTDDEKMKQYRDRLEEIDDILEENKAKAKEAIIGDDLKSAIEEFVSTYSQAWEDGTDAAQKSTQIIKKLLLSAFDERLKGKISDVTEAFYDKLVEALKDGNLTDAELKSLDVLKAQIDAISAEEEEQYKKILERYKDIDELREELTDISFDSVRDNFKSLLSDMESSTSDFTSSFTEMLRNALIEGLMNEKYDVMLKEWYDEFARAMEDHTISDEERDALRKKYDSIVNQGIEDRNFIKDIIGGDAFSQTASTGSAWNMSQETGEELSGRFTALVELEAINNNLVTEGNTFLKDILQNIQLMARISMTPHTDNEDTALAAIRDMMFLSTGYLEDIASHTKHLNIISSEISEMKDAIKRI